MLDQYNEGTYKLTMYPHCHYTDSQGQMRAIDWYGCVPVDKPYIEEKYIRGQRTLWVTQNHPRKN